MAVQELNPPNPYRLTELSRANMRNNGGSGITSRP